jgi:tetratricopeptide (TPR) repeat protein
MTEKLDPEQPGEPKDEGFKHLLGLALFNSLAGHMRRALDYARAALKVTEDTQELIQCYLMLGGLEEQVDDFYSAIAYYSLGLSQKPSDKDHRYFFNNNLAYCLNEVGKYEESEPYCRKAILTDARRHNAHKNLGISMQAQGQYTKAARCYLRAVRLGPADPRALEHLEELVCEHPEVSVQMADIEAQIEECRELVSKAVRAKYGLPEEDD